MPDASSGLLPIGNGEIPPSRVNNAEASPSIPWYHLWFGADYLHLYRHRSADEAAGTVAWLLSEISLSPTARVLDLGCGNGRHALELARRGVPTVGLDLSWRLLTDIPGDRAALERLRADMRRLPFRTQSFDLVLSLFTSFGYFEAEDDARVLAQAARVLKPGGILVLDFMNASRVKRDLVPDERLNLQGKNYAIRRWVDPAAQRVEKRISIRDGQRVTASYRESVRLYTLDELRGLLQLSGLSVRKTFGDYQGKPFTDLSPRLIILGAKSG